MKDINTVVLVGRLVRDSELSYSQSGYAFLKFSVAVNRSKKQGDSYVDDPSFFDVVLFGKMGEAIVNYMTKGKQVCVGGSLKQDRWEEQDGSKRSKVHIEADTVQLLGGAKQSGGNGGNVDQEYNPASAPKTMGANAAQPSDGDIPF